MLQITLNPANNRQPVNLYAHSILQYSRTPPKIQECHGNERQPCCWGMLIIALDYEYAPASELTCTKDARTMYRMAGRAGVDDITIITDKEPKLGRAWRW